MGEKSERHKLASLKAQPGSHHHFSNAETYQLATFINARFEDEPLLSTILPVDGAKPDEFFGAWGDGRLLICLVDAACEGVVDLDFMRRKASKPQGVRLRHPTIQHFAVLNDALQGCKNIDGLRLGFVGAEDFVQGNRPVILGVGWQLVRLAILQTANVDDRPELSELFTPEEAAKNMGQAGQEELVLSRWFNQFLGAVGSERQVWSFGAELADGVAWCTLLNAIDPSACPPPDEHDAEANAASVIEAVHKMEVKGVFMTKEALLESDKKQNVMFCAQLMNVFPTIPTYLRPPPTFKSGAGGSSKRGSGRAPFSTTYDSRGGSGASTTDSSMYTSSPAAADAGGGGGRGTPRYVGSSSAPPPAPSPPRSRWSFGFTDNTAGRVHNYNSDDEGESGPGCGLGFSIFGCISRN